MAARCLGGRRNPQLRHARHPRVLARTPARPIGRRLVGSHHRPTAQPLRLRHGQRGRGPDREAPGGGGDGQPPDSAGGSRRTHEGRAGDRGSLPRRPAVAGCCAGRSEGTPARTGPLHGHGSGNGPGHRDRLGKCGPYRLGGGEAREPHPPHQRGPHSARAARTRSAEHSGRASANGHGYARQGSACGFAMSVRDGCSLPRSSPRARRGHSPPRPGRRFTGASPRSARPPSRTDRRSPCTNSQ